MKTLFIFCLLALVTSTAFRCEKTDTPNDCYKAKLVKKGICLNYTITVLSGNMDAQKIEATWTDPNTNITYQNAFRLGSVCNFPTDIEEGEEFYFSLDADAGNSCAVCQAYYPTPAKVLAIKVLDSPCQ